MSMINASARTPEVGETVATYAKYEGAQKAVSQLIAANVPARDIAIVGSALRSVEKVTGRLGWAQAAWQGALNGVMLGLLFAAFTVIWVPQIDMAMLGGVLLIGVGLGMLFRILSYTIVRRRRDYASIMTVAADHYEVAVASAHVTEARAVLGTTKPRTTVAQPPSNEPPRYGVRIADQKPSAPAPAPSSSADADIPPEDSARLETPARGDEPSENAEGPAHPDGSAGPASGDQPRD